MRFFSNLLGYFLAGLIFWFPIGIIVVVSIYIFGNLEDLGKDVISFSLSKLSKPTDNIHSGLGIAFWLIIFFITGLILRRTSVGTLFSKIPILGLFFRKKGEAVTIDKLMTLSPCLFLNTPTCPSYGWILSEQRVKIDNEIAPFELINVYHPNIPTMVTGQVYSVRKDTIIRIGNPSREVIDILLYGFRKPESIHYLPWEGESEQEFRQRARRFGLAFSGELGRDAETDLICLK